MNDGPITRETFERLCRAVVAYINQGLRPHTAYLPTKDAAEGANTRQPWQLHTPGGAVLLRFTNGLKSGEIVLRCLEKREAELAEELASARAILADLLEDRGESWLAQLAGRREELLHLLSDISNWTDTTTGNNSETCERCNREYSGDTHHPQCIRASLLRIVGGPEETQRQVDAAHEAALAMARPGVELGRWPTTYPGRWRLAPDGPWVGIGPVDPDPNSNATVLQTPPSGDGVEP